MCRLSQNQTLNLQKSLDSGAPAALCEAFGGAYITVPLGNRPEPYKVRIMRLIDEGKAPPQIARELGTTERYVRTILSRYQRKPPPTHLLLKITLINIGVPGKKPPV